MRLFVVRPPTSALLILLLALSLSVRISCTSAPSRDDARQRSGSSSASYDVDERCAAAVSDDDEDHDKYDDASSRQSAGASDRLDEIIFNDGDYADDSDADEESVADDDDDDGDALAELISILHLGEFYVNGTWTDPLRRGSSDPLPPLIVVDPSTSFPIASVAVADATDVDRAVRSASEALDSWSLGMTSAARRSCMVRLLELYVERWEDMALLISAEMGAPIDAARDEQVGSGAYHIERTIEEMGEFEFERSLPSKCAEDDDDCDDDDSSSATRIFMEPVGVVGMITPWNWPMNQIAIKVLPALAVGCTCVLKPSERSPLSALLFAELIDSAGFPPGVFNVVNGDGPGAGAALASHPSVDMISFTGSTRGGSAVSLAAAPAFRRVALELGGKGAYVIFADVVGGGGGLEGAVEDGVRGCFENSGQSCNAPTRMLVESSAYDDAVRIAASAANSIAVGSAHAAGDHIGPVASLDQWERVQNYIRTGIEEGARLVAGGLGKPDYVVGLDNLPGVERENAGGYYIRPTVFADCRPTMIVMREEIFGPVLCMTPFDSEEEAVRIANGTPYGLTNYVRTRNVGRARRLARALRSGMVEMNGEGLDYGSPFGGMKSSGVGREGGQYGMEGFCEIKAVSGWYGDDEDGYYK